MLPDFLFLFTTNSGLGNEGENPGMERSAGSPMPRLPGFSRGSGENGVMGFRDSRAVLRGDLNRRQQDYRNMRVEKEGDMIGQDKRIGDRSMRSALSFMHSLLGTYHPRDFAVRFWDGTVWEAEPGEPTRFTLVIHSPRALHSMFWMPNEVRLGKAYIHDDLDIEGDIEAIFNIGDYVLNTRLGVNDWLSCAGALLRLSPNGRRSPDTCRIAKLSGGRHSRERDRQAVCHHYDISNDFFALWLDRAMVYSCAYFEEPDEDLDRAQERKLDYICRKLRLRPGERLLDIGCGWGALVMHAARHFGVTARGITLSRPQADLANKRIHEEGLSERCRVDIRDYRLADESGAYDKLVSVGMFEHVGASQLPEYFGCAWQLLRPGGAFLNHGISSSITWWKTRGPSFADIYVFPDKELLPLNTVLRAAELKGFEVRDVESLREHYAMTLSHWVRRLEARKDEVRRVVNDVTYRIWRLYMAGAAHRFRTGRINVYQVLLSKPDRGCSGLPLTRADWYR